MMSTTPINLIGALEDVPSFLKINTASFPINIFNKIPAISAIDHKIFVMSIFKASFIIFQFLY